MYGDDPHEWGQYYRDYIYSREHDRPLLPKSPTWKELTPERRKRLEDCSIAYIKRLLLEENPSGEFYYDERDRNGLPRWYPSAQERQPCCSYDPPLHFNRLRFYTHCRSIEHLANLYHVDVNFLRQRLDSMRIETLNSIRQRTNSYSDHLEWLAYIAAGYAELMCGDDPDEWRRHYLDYIKGRVTFPKATNYAELMCNDDPYEWGMDYLNCIKDPTVADNKKKYP
jgi:hypothetical protein